MKVVVLYRRASEHGRMAEEFVHEFRRLHPSVIVEEKDPDTKEGAELAKLYDVTSPPAILALKDDGAVLNTWQGEDLPLMNDVASYVAIG
jgi:hypothetical protein